MMKRNTPETLFVNVLNSIGPNAREGNRRKVWQKVWMRPIENMAPEVVMAIKEVLDEQSIWRK